jgi:hypothetical protein
MDGDWSQFYRFTKVVLLHFLHLHFEKTTFYALKILGVHVFLRIMFEFFSSFSQTQWETTTTQHNVLYTQTCHLWQRRCKCTAVPQTTHCKAYFEKEKSRHFPIFFFHINTYFKFDPFAWHWVGTIARLQSIVSRDEYQGYSQRGIIEKCRIRHLCTSQFRWWQISVETPLEGVVYREELTQLFISTESLSTPKHSHPPPPLSLSVSWLLTAPI